MTTGAASDWLRPRLGRTWHAGRVVGTSPRAAYVSVSRQQRDAGRVDDHVRKPPDWLLAVEGPDAVGLPNGVVLADDALLGRLRVGEAVLVGRRALAGDGWEVHVRRWHRSRPVPGPAGPGPARARLQALGASPERPQPGSWPSPDPRLVAGACDLVAIADGRAGDDATASVSARLLGYGPGSTPAGDDLLAGFLATVVVLAPAWQRGEVVDRTEALATHLLAVAPERTTGLSATLLACAVDGAMAGPAAAVLAALTAVGERPGTSEPTPRDLGARLDELGRIGHSSGHDLALGIVAAALQLAASPITASGTTPGITPGTTPETTPGAVPARHPGTSTLATPRPSAIGSS